MIHSLTKTSVICTQVSFSFTETLEPIQSWRLSEAKEKKLYYNFHCRGV